MPDENKQICILEYLPGKDVDIQTRYITQVVHLNKFQFSSRQFTFIQIVHRNVLIYA